MSDAVNLPFGFKTFSGRNYAPRQEVFLILVFRVILRRKRNENIVGSIRTDIAETAHHIALTPAAIFPLAGLLPDQPPSPQTEFPSDIAVVCIRSLLVKARSGVRQTGAPLATIVLPKSRISLQR